MNITIDNPRLAEGFLPARQVWERYGVTSMTIHRWLLDNKMNFPKPVYLGRFRYWRISDIEKWERKRILDSGLEVCNEGTTWN